MTGAAAGVRGDARDQVRQNVILGLEEKIDTLSTAQIAGQVATIVRACIAGLMTREKEDVIRV